MIGVQTKKKIQGTLTLGEWYLKLNSVVVIHWNMLTSQSRVDYKIKPLKPCFSQARHVCPSNRNCHILHHKFGKHF